MDSKLLMFSLMIFGYLLLGTSIFVGHARWSKRLLALGVLALATTFLMVG